MENQPETTQISEMNGLWHELSDNESQSIAGAASNNVVYGNSGLGAIGLGTLAFFGRFQWSWFFGLMGGLVSLSGINSGIGYPSSNN